MADIFSDSTTGENLIALPERSAATADAAAAGRGSLRRSVRMTYSGGADGGGKRSMTRTSLSSSRKQSQETTSVLGHLKRIFQLWWRHLTMRAAVPMEDMERLRESCGLRDSQITGLYKQFRLLMDSDDPKRGFLTVQDLEHHSSLLDHNPLKKYIFRMIFWNQERLSFPEFVENLALMVSNCVGAPQLHLVRRPSEMSYFTGVTSPKDVVQMQKLLALFNCFDLKETGSLDTHCLSHLVHDLLKCDSDLSVSSLVPHSMIGRMVNTAIVNVHDKFSSVCEDICSGGGLGGLGFNEIDDRQSIDTNLSLTAAGNLYEGHRTLLTKELFIRDQEDLHLDQLMAMRL